MSLTAAQLTTLKADIQANTDPVVIAALAAGNNSAIADWYNLDASPAYWVWKDSVDAATLGNNIDGVSLKDMTTGNLDRLNAFYLTNPGGAIPSRSDHRAFFDDTFSGVAGAPTVTRLVPLFQRQASNVEKLFATGSGTQATGLVDAGPSTMGFSGSVSSVDIRNALNS